jgi:hypothetical protein
MRLTAERLDYDAVHAGRSEWRMLSPIDHPEEPARCMISGTGLTHLGSARDRQFMHAVATDEMTDSMKMFLWGREGGRPATGQVGIPPEWFYKGRGRVCAPMDNHSRYRLMQRTAAKRRRLPASTWLARRERLIGLAWLVETSSRTIASKRRTI